MALFNKASLEALKQKVDLIEVLSSHMELKRSGAAYKGLCPFHDEKSPSFIVQRGDSHYHCFGCGAHGDAIQFLMAHQKMSFSDAVESLAQRFSVHLEVVEEGKEKKGPDKALLKEALEIACQFYHFALLHSEEGHSALHYLYDRGIELDFIRFFKIGLAPKQPGMLRKVMQQKKIRDDVLVEAGLLAISQEGRYRDFFSDRILFPILQAGDVIGFSGRKYKEETFGGKYINTPETALFKKSRVLFGLSFCRKRIAKERKAIIVEGQIDALRLIWQGFNITVAGQGTAFGEGHVKELVQLGVNLVFLALDSDQAGQEASAKIGHLIQKEGIEVRVLSLPPGDDPDSFLRRNGSLAFLELMEKASDYLTFLISHLGRQIDLHSPAGKNELITNATKMIREWDHPVMVHETLRKLAGVMQVPEEIVGIGQEPVAHFLIKKSASIASEKIDPDRILETDLLRWLLLYHQEFPHFIAQAQANLKEEDFRIPICRKIFLRFMENALQNRPSDLLSLAIDLDNAEAQLVLSSLIQKKIHKERGNQQFIETIQKILDRNWMEKREAIKIKIQSGQCSDEEIHALAKLFDELRRSPPIVNLSLNGIT